MSSHSRLPDGAQLSARAWRSFDRLFEGEVSAWIYPFLRISLACVFLVREADWLRPWIALEHQQWVRGLDFSWSISADPYLVSPLIPGFALGSSATYVLVRVRTALGFALLVGWRPRVCATLLAAVSYALFVSDRYRYFHHLHVLYLSIAWLALAPSEVRIPSLRWSPIWPLQLLRALVMGIYFAAGSAKLCDAWLSGRTLRDLARLHAVDGPVWALLQRVANYGGCAKLTCATELALPLLLCWRRTRRVAILVGVCFHILLGACMRVSTFGLEMTLLLLAFLPSSRPAQRAAPTQTQAEAHSNNAALTLQSARGQRMLKWW